MNPEYIKLIFIVVSIVLNTWIVYTALKSTCKYLEELAKIPGDTNLLTINRNMVISNWTIVSLNTMFIILYLAK